MIEFVQEVGVNGNEEIIYDEVAQFCVSCCDKGNQVCVLWNVIVWRYRGEPHGVRNEVETHTTSYEWDVVCDSGFTDEEERQVWTHHRINFFEHCQRYRGRGYYRLALSNLESLLESVGVKYPE